MESSLTAKAPNNMVIDPAEAHPATPGFQKSYFQSSLWASSSATWQLFCNIQKCVSTWGVMFAGQKAFSVSQKTNKT